MRVQRMVAALMICLLLAACGRPAAEDGRPQSTACQPLSGVETAPEGVSIAGVRAAGPAPFAWSESGSSVAFQRDDGIGIVGASGQEGVLLPAKGEAPVLLGWWRDQVLFLEIVEESLHVLLGAQDCATKLVAEFPFDGTPHPLLEARLTGDTLVLIGRGPLLAAIQLESGQTRALPGELAVSLSQQMGLSADGRYLATKMGNRADPVSVIDLETGEVHAAADEAHVGVMSWAPGARQWAVRASDPDAGLPVSVGANHVEGATHLVIGQPDGQTRALLPPTALTLVAGPYWAPNGVSIAVAAGTARGPTDGATAELYATEIWAVEPATGRWHKVGALAPDGGGDAGRGWLWGWQDESHLLVQEGGHLYRWQIETGKREPIMENAVEIHAQPNGNLLVVAGARQETLYLVKPGAAPNVILSGSGGKFRPAMANGHIAVLTAASDGRVSLAILPTAR